MKISCIWGDKLDGMHMSVEGKVLNRLSHMQLPPTPLYCAELFAMLAADFVIYSLLAFWLDKVVPSRYGVRRAPWFCFTSSYWCPPEKSKKAVSPLDKKHDYGPVDKSMMGKEAVQLRLLHKVYHNKRYMCCGTETFTIALNEVSLDMYEGEITAILGHNGAGKSTLYNVLTGMTEVTRGEANIFGFDVTDQDGMENIRGMTGICPQKDSFVLFDYLTPRDHLEYYGIIRGIEEKRLEEAVSEMLEDINLTDKENALAKNLSGGQKRKLCVGMALIGDPKLVFLDEPTAGVDPYSRRFLWALLKKKKAGKAMLLTTHYMDEADELADRKAILDNGKVRAFGTSGFLKKRFGIGYHLTLVLEVDNAIQAINRMVKKTVPGSYIGRRSGNELSFVLPQDDDSIEKFPLLFEKVIFKLNYVFIVKMLLI